jgi:hypothetical protein
MYRTKERTGDAKSCGQEANSNTVGRKKAKKKKERNIERKRGWTSRRPRRKPWEGSSGVIKKFVKR